MTLDPQEHVRRWLAAERQEPPDAADEAFRLVFRLVPRHEPTPALAGRVLAAMQPPRRAPQIPALADARWLKPLIAASLLLSGLAALALSVPFPLPRVGSFFSAFFSTLASAAVGVSHAVDFGLSVWALLSDVGLALRAAVFTPPIAVALVLNAALAIALLLGLRRLMAPYEETL